MKVFEIGLEHTGSRSIAVVAQRIGLVTTHSIKDLALKEDWVRKVLAGRSDFWIVDRNDYCGHLMFPVFEDAIIRYPDARFILPVRPVEEWLEGIRKVFVRMTAKQAKKVIKSGSPQDRLTNKLVDRVFCGVFTLLMRGSLEFNPDRLREWYKNHYNRVEQAFSGAHANRLLRVDVSRAGEANRFAFWLGRRYGGEFPNVRRGTGLTTLDFDIAKRTAEGLDLE